MGKRSTKAGSSGRAAKEARADPLTEVLARYREPLETGFDAAWVGLEPTFANARSVRRFAELVEEEGGEDRYFEDEKLVALQRKVARGIARRYRTRREKGDDACPFAEVELEHGCDQWDVERAELKFHWADRALPPFDVRLGRDPEVFEYSIKPVPVAWLYDDRFVRFLEQFVWRVPQENGLVVAIAHGGGQFHASAKTYLAGSLLADDVAHRLDHPELASWILDFPNPDDRAFRATARRAAAFAKVIDEYWRGAYHPRATGTPTVESAYLDRGFEPAPDPPAGLLDPVRGPIGDAREAFQANFTFGRAVRLRAQDVEPGYWQSAHPDEDGYRPDQVMRYSEGNLNRLQIAGEWHVKSGKVLDEDDVRALEEPLDPSMLYDEASWEHRAQMSRTSARDAVEAVLLEMHHAQWLAGRPHVRLRGPLVQDQLLGDAERTLERFAPKVLAKLHRAARKENLAASRGRMKTDRIEPEALFWAAWKHLPAVERALIAHEAILGFVERVENAATKDPRPDARADPMEWHRHRVHPLLWKALEETPGALDREVVVRREHGAWTSRTKEYLARRPVWSPLATKPPWKRGG